MFIRLFTFVSCFALMALGMGCASINAQNNNQYSKANASIIVNNVVNSQTISLGKNTTLHIQGGKFRNCHIKGSNTTVNCNTEQVVFENCTFSGTFSNSSLKATNFGCKSDMSTRAIVWSSKDGKRVKTKQRHGSDNKKSLESLAQFCSNSSNISIDFNGAFFTPIVDNIAGRPEGKGNILTIKSANALTLRGGTLIQGFYFVNCSKVRMSDISFVGYHEIHDFPTLYYKAASFSNPKGTFYQAIKSGKYSVKNTGNIVGDQYQALGIAGANTIQFVTEKGSVSKDILIENCNFEMRTAGICVGHNNFRCDVRDVVIRNCNFSHMYFQPLGFTGATRVTVDNVHSDYCLQGVDIDRWVSQLVVKNSTFLNCYNGPKQELTLKMKSDTENSYDICFDNCHIQINERIKYVDLAHYIFTTGQTTEHDKFVIKNCTFDIDCNMMPVGGFNNRNSQLELNNITINLHSSTNHDKYDVARLFNTAGTLLFGANYTPRISLKNVKINVDGTRLAYIASPAGQRFALDLNNVAISGNGSCVYPAFSNLSELSMNGTTIGIDCKSSLIEKTPHVSLDYVKCSHIGGMVYNNGGIDEALVSIRNSELNCQSNFLNLIQAKRAQVDIQSNKLTCQSLVNLADDPTNLSLNVKANIAKVTGNVVFSGVAKAKKSFVPEHVVVTGNTFNASSRSTLFDNTVSSNARRVFSQGSNTINVR